MQQGKVKHYNQERGFGFISGGAKDIFFHSSEVVGTEICKGDIVSFSVRESKKGPEAYGVRVISFTQ